LYTIIIGIYVIFYFGGDEMIMNRKQIVREKLQQILSGYSAYAETKEVADLLKKELKQLNIDVYEDSTDIGSWFIPIETSLKTEANLEIQN
jgi:uncharacterized membrane protein